MGQEGQRTGTGMNRNGDGEVENSGILAERWAACLRWAGGCGEHLGLELQKLAHEAEVGRDDAAPLLDELKSLVQLDTVGAHEVGQADGGWARDARLAVHEDAATFVSHGVYRKKGTQEVTLNKHISAQFVFP